MPFPGLENVTFMKSIPLIAVFLGTFMLVLLAAEIGYRLGAARLKGATHEKEEPVGAMVGSTLGLLAFMLAITFGLAGDYYQNKRVVLLEEANAVGTTWLRTDFLPESERDAARGLLREYVDVRLAAAKTGEVEPAMRRSADIHDLLWAQAQTIMNRDPGSEAVGLYIQTLNDMIDLHAKRIAVALRTSIPDTIWIGLYAIAFFAFGMMGYHNGLAATNRSFAALAVAITFSAVIWLIADLDTAQKGTLRVSQQALVDLRESMEP